MTYTGIISSKMSMSEYRVRIPELNKAVGVIGATPDDELYVARVSAPCGIWPEYKSGDKVFVTFLTFGSATPLILGLQYIEESKSRYSSAHFTDLQVTVNSTLPEDTKIGQVTSTNIKCLLNLTQNIDSKFREIDTTNVSQDTTLKSHSDELVVMNKEITINKENISSLSTNLSTLSTKHDTLLGIFNTHNNNKEKHVTKQKQEDWSNAMNKINDLYADGKLYLSKSNENSSNMYGTKLPTDNLKEGQLFFLIYNE